MIHHCSHYSVCNRNSCSHKISLSQISWLCGYKNFYLARCNDYNVRQLNVAMVRDKIWSNHSKQCFDTLQHECILHTPLSLLIAVQLSMYRYICISTFTVESSMASWLLFRALIVCTWDLQFTASEKCTVQRLSVQSYLHSIEGAKLQNHTCMRN